jgi:hypothetical protein
VGSMLEADSHPDGKRVVGGCFAVHGVYRKGNYGFPFHPSYSADCGFGLVERAGPRP